MPVVEKFTAPAVESRLILAAVIVLRIPSLSVLEAVTFTCPVPGAVAEVAAPNAMPPLPAVKLTVFMAVIGAPAFWTMPPVAARVTEVVPAPPTAPARVSDSAVPVSVT